jgi:hypothetical protein
VNVRLLAVMRPVNGYTLLLCSVALLLTGCWWNTQELSPITEVCQRGDGKYELRFLDNRVLYGGVHSPGVWSSKSEWSYDVVVETPALDGRIDAASLVVRYEDTKRLSTSRPTRYMASPTGSIAFNKRSIQVDIRSTRNQHGYVHEIYGSSAWSQPEPGAALPQCPPILRAEPNSASLTDAFSSLRLAYGAAKRER